MGLRSAPRLALRRPGAVSGHRFGRLVSDVLDFCPLFRSHGELQSVEALISLLILLA
jgi:hypothetical protein